MDTVGSGVFWSAEGVVGVEGYLKCTNIQIDSFRNAPSHGKSTWRESSRLTSLPYVSKHAKTGKFPAFKNKMAPSSTASRNIQQRLRSQPCRHGPFHHGRFCNISPHSNHLTLSETPFNSCTLTLSTDFLFRPDNFLTGGNGVV